MISTFASSVPYDVVDQDIFEQESLYHSHAWLRVIEDGFDTKVRYIITKSKGEIVSIMPFAIRNKFGLVLCGSPLQGLFTEFIGPRFRKGLTRDESIKILESQIQLLVSRRFFYNEISLNESFPGGINDLSKMLIAYSFVYQPRPSLVIELSKGSDAVWAGFEGRARNMIRKAEKSKIECSVEKLELKNLSEYIEMLSATFQRQGRVLPHPVAAYQNLAFQIQPENKLFFVAARLENALVAGGIFLLDRNRMLFHSGSATQAGMKYAASSLVQWNAIQEGIGRGILLYDLGGVGLSTIDKFKTSFGGAPIEHHRWVRASRTLRWVTDLGKWMATKGLIRIYG
jgi:hypothetical protein